jgi:diguanylate cyclase (GGDEF)-like protein
VTWVRRRIPADVLGRTRLAAVAIGCIALLMQLGQIGNHTKSPRYHLLAGACILLMMAILVISYRRARTYRWDLIALPPLIVVGASGLLDPVSGVALALAVTVPLSLYGPLWVWAVRIATALVAFPAGVAVSPMSMDRRMDWNSATVLGVLPQLLLMGVTMRGIYAALLRQARMTQREAVLARTGRRLLGAQTVAEIREVARQAAEELVALSPGTVLLVLRRSADADGILTVANQAGVPAALRGARLAAGAPLDQLVDGVREWRSEELDDGRIVAVGGRRSVPDDVLAAFGNLSHQVLLAETSRVTHEELDHRANHDHLTRLPTRAKFFRALAEAVDRGEPGTIALLNIDLDDFKQVNDVHGHAAGDELLVQVADRINAAGGPGAMAGRFGGDEFGLLLTGVSGPAEAEHVAQRLCARLVAPVRLSGATVGVGASIGVALSMPGQTAGDLARSADIAMYSAKARGKSRVEMFAEAVHGEVARLRTLEDQLPYAVERGEITVAFQPWADAATGAWTGVEALFQWRHRGIHLIDCRELLALAERTGTLSRITRYVLRQIAAGLTGLPGVRVGLNIGAHQLLDADFTDNVLDTLDECGFPPDRLIVEIIESEHLDDPAARDQLHRLADRGVRVALDDFGTGYVSLSALRAFPIHRLKVDGAFLAGDPGALDLVLSMGRLLDTETIVLGVHEPAQLDRVRRLGADAAQGDAVAGLLTGEELRAAWTRMAAA